jgi:hypothetical protein
MSGVRREAALIEKIEALAEQLDEASRIQLDPYASDLAVAAGIIRSGTEKALAARLRSILPTQGEPQ